MDIAIRPYSPADLEACRTLWAVLTEYHRTLYGDPGIGGDHPELHFDGHLQRVGPGRLWVAAVAGEVCGMAGLIVREEEGEIEPVVVSPAHRGRGVGQALLARVRAEAEALHLRFLCVRPVARNAEAVAFFHQAGFRLLGQVELFTELPASDRTWEEGPTLHGHPFRY